MIGPYAAMFVNGIYPWKSLKTSSVSPGKLRNLVFASPGKSCTNPDDCIVWFFMCTCIAEGNHWQSLRRFLELGIVTTDFFTEPVTKNIYNDQVCTKSVGPIMYTLHEITNWWCVHMAQLMPLPLAVSCSSKSRLILPSWFYLSGTGSLRLSRTKSRGP